MELKLQCLLFVFDQESAIFNRYLYECLVNETSIHLDGLHLFLLFSIQIHNYDENALFLLGLSIDKTSLRNQQYFKSIVLLVSLFASNETGSLSNISNANISFHHKISVIYQFMNTFRMITVMNRPLVILN